MPRFVTGDMWDVIVDSEMFCITCNSTLRRDGALTMGAGIARQAQEKLPGLPHVFGRKLQAAGLAGKRYGTLTVEHGFLRITAFQTKVHFMESSTLDLIEFSVGKLLEEIEQLSPSRVDLNFPGIGLGGLEPDEVKPVLAALPDNVFIWTYNGVKGINS
jgi:hypothetical protein